VRCADARVKLRALPGDDADSCACGVQELRELEIRRGPATQYIMPTTMVLPPAAVQMGVPASYAAVPAPPPPAAEQAKAPAVAPASALAEWCEQNGVSAAHAALLAAGVNSPADLKYLSEADVDNMKLPPVTCNKVKALKKANS
jgi:hypothetical protein